MNNTYEKPLFNSFSHMLFIAFVSFNGFFIYLPQFLFSTFCLFLFIITIFILNRNGFSIFPLSFPLSSHISCYILPLSMLRCLSRPGLWLIYRTSCWSGGFFWETCIWMVEFRVGILTVAALFPLYTSSVCGVRLDNRYPGHFLILLLYSHRRWDIQIRTGPGKS